MNGSPVQGGCALREQRPVLDNFSEERRVCRELFPFQPCRQLFNRCRDVPSEFKLWPVIFIDVGRDNVNMDEITLLVAVPKGWFVLDWVITNGKNQISRIKEFVRWLGMEKADAAAETIKDLSWYNSRPLICANRRQVRFGE
jgi:hypothetical protein